MGAHWLSPSPAGGQPRAPARLLGLPTGCRRVPLCMSQLPSPPSCAFRPPHTRMRISLRPPLICPLARARCCQLARPVPQRRRCDVAGCLALWRHAMMQCGHVTWAACAPASFARQPVPLCQCPAAVRAGARATLTTPQLQGLARRAAAGISGHDCDSPSFS